MTHFLRRMILALVCLALAGAAGAWLLSAPDMMPAEALPAHDADSGHGAALFAIAGCSSCHAAEGAKGEERLLLGGGRAFVTAFGTFHAPNISPDPAAGIGDWRPVDFVNAMRHGVAPGGTHLYPAFPYTSYARMTVPDMLDLWAYLKTLPPSDRASRPHEIPFPFSIRRALGLWKLLYLDPAPVVAVEGSEPERGRYLVEGAGHCGECHTPRDVLGGAILGRWLGGAPNPEGRGTIPNITPGGTAIAGWSTADIAEYLKSGFTPEFDTAGGSMAEVTENTASLTDADRHAIALYLKAIPAVPAGDR